MIISRTLSNPLDGPYEVQLDGGILVKKFSPPRVVGEDSDELFCVRDHHI